MNWPANTSIISKCIRGVSRAKILFDECLGMPMVEALKTALSLGPDEAELAHVIPMGFGGVHDDVWIPQIAADGWIVVTCDRGTHQTDKGKKLPDVCREKNVTYVALSRALAKRTTPFKMAAILSVWDQILADVHEAPRGTGFQIRLTNSGAPSLVEQWPLPKEEGPKSQSNRFE